MGQYHMISDYKQRTKMFVNNFIILFYCYFSQHFRVNLYTGLSSTYW